MRKVRNESQQRNLNTPLTTAPANPDRQQSINQEPLCHKKELPASDPVEVQRVAEPSSRKSTGPRTVQGKTRSKFNALKHGLFSKALLLKGESPVEYQALFNGLWDDLQPQGKLETVLVENLATVLWRKRRVFQAENAEISAKMEFTEGDFIVKRFVEAWDWSRAPIASGGLLKYSNNPIIVREARLMLMIFRERVIERGFKEDSPILKRLYGETGDGAKPSGLRLIYESYATSAKLTTENGDKSENAELKEIMVKLIESEIERLTEVEIVLTSDTQQKINYKSSAAIIPDQEASDRLLRYETHLNREIDSVLNRLERLQRMRKAQPLPPQVDVRIS